MISISGLILNTNHPNNRFEPHFNGVLTENYTKLYITHVDMYQTKICSQIFVEGHIIEVYLKPSKCHYQNDLNKC